MHVPRLIVMVAAVILLNIPLSAGGIERAPYRGLIDDRPAPPTLDNPRSPSEEEPAPVAFVSPRGPRLSTNCGGPTSLRAMMIRARAAAAAAAGTAPTAARPPAVAPLRSRATT